MHDLMLWCVIAKRYIALTSFFFFRQQRTSYFPNVEFLLSVLNEKDIFFS